MKSRVVYTAQYFVVARSRTSLYAPSLRLVLLVSPTLHGFGRAVDKTSLGQRTVTFNHPKKDRKIEVKRSPFVLVSPTLHGFGRAIDKTLLGQRTVTFNHPKKDRKIEIKRSPFVLVSPTLHGFG